MRHSTLHSDMAAAPSVMRRALTYCLACLLAWQPLLANAGGITPTQASNGRPTLDQAPNGVPVINIQNPNAKGVSQNFYQDFNVGQRGVVLNNNRTLHQTQLGGVIEGNPNLKSGSASLILNEVIGANPSALNGYMEVGGVKADVIVANPNGISCSGCGFINTNHATLTTGKPLLDASGALQGFNVEQGQVTIGGDGLNATNVDRFDIIARGVKLSAELHANELNVVTGKQQVASDTLATSQVSTDGDAPDFAIDSSELGGIYADRIRLIANEQGVGVKLDAPVAAQSGDLVLTADGKIRFADASASHDMQVTSSSDVTVTGTAAATNALRIDAASFAAKGQQVSANTVNINAAHTQVASGATLYGIDQLGIEGDSLDNAGDIASDHNITIGANAALASLNNTGSVFAGGDLSLHAHDLTNASGAALNAGNNIDISASNSLTNQGNLLAQHRLTLVTDSLTNERLADAPEGSGLLGSVDGDTHITAGQTRNLAGALFHSGGQLQLDVTSLDNSGEIEATHGLTIHADDLTNASGAALSADHDIHITSDSLTNQGKILAQQNLVLNTRQLTNARLASAPADSYDGLLGGLGSSAISADTINNLLGAQIYGDQLTLDATTLDNSGNISALADLTLGGQGALASLRNAGSMSAGQNLDVHAIDLANGSGAIIQANDINASLIGDLTNQGQLLALHNLVLDARSLSNERLASAPETSNDGVLGGLASASLTADTITNLVGATLYGGDTLNLTATRLDNTGGVSAGQNLSVHADDLTNDSGAVMRADRDIDITASRFTNAGSITNQLPVSTDDTSGIIAIVADTISNLTGAMLYSTGGLNLDAASLDNGGLLLADGKLAIGDNAALASMHNAGTVGAGLLTVNSTSLTNDSSASMRAGQATITLTGDLLNLGQLLAQNGLWLTASKVTNQRLENAAQTDATLGGTGYVQINADNLDNLGGALLGAGGSMALIIKDTLRNDHSDIQSQDSLYIAAAFPPAPASDDTGTETDTPTDADMAEQIDALKNVEVSNKGGQIISTNGDIYIYTHHLDNSRHVTKTEDHHISAYDLMEANWLALHDDDSENDHFRLGGTNAALSEDDWLFVFDPGVYDLPFYQCECDGWLEGRYFVNPGSVYWHQKFADFWLSNYINYLKSEYGVGLSSSLVSKVRAQLVSSEAKANAVDGGTNPVAQSMWIIARTSQLIKEYEPETYDQLKAAVTQKIKTDYDTLKVWNTTCNDWQSDDCDNGSANHFQYSADRYDEVVSSDSEAVASLISAGGGLYVNADTIDNQFSTIASAGDMVLNGGDIRNDGFTLQRHYQIRWRNTDWHNGANPDWRPPDDQYTGWDPITVDLLDENGNPQVAKSLIVAGGSLSGTLEGDLKNRDATYVVEHHMPDFDDGSFQIPEEPVDKPDAPEQDAPPAEAGDEPEPPAYVDFGGSDVTRVIDTINARTLELLNGHSSLFHVNTDPSQPYVIETNPLFATPEGVKGSEYLIDRLGLTPDITQRRLGDSYYETTLIRDAVIDATGTRFLDPDFKSDADQFAWLMDNAIAAAESMHLAVGVSLTADQVNALQQDIVWMEEKEVAGMKVLVPVLYLAPGSANLATQGAVISANHGMNLTVNGLANSGVMAAGEDLSITAGEHGVINLEGLIQSGGVLGVNSKGNIQNLSSTMRGRDVSLHSDHNIINSAWVNQTKEDWVNGTYLRTEHGDGSLIEGADTGNVILDAANIAVVGSDVKGGNVNMTARGNIVVGSLGVTNAFDGHAGAAEYTNHDTYNLASNIDATLDLLAIAGNGIEVTGSTMHAGNNLGLKALNGDITIKSAADEHEEKYHYEDSDEETTRHDKTVKQVRSQVSAGGTMDINAVLGNLMVTASGLDSGGDMSLNAGQTIQFLAAKNEEYHFAQTDKDGDYGSKSHKKDETNKITNEVASLNSGGKLTISSGGDQTYQAAQLNSTGDIHIVSGGHVSFEAVKNLVSESHESSSGDLAWNKMAGDGKVNETLLQTEITTQANLAIDAAEGLSIDVNDINAKTISDTIDAMVAKDPKLAWLKDAEARGDVDWQKIKETHDSWDYESQSMGAATALVVAMVATVATAGAGGAIAGAVGMGSSTVAVATAGAVAASAATQTASAVINNQGNLGNAFDDFDHSGTYKGIATAGATAGLMAGVDAGFSNMDFGKIQGDTVNGITHGFDFNSYKGMAGFAAYKGVEAGVSAGVSSSVFGTSFDDAFKSNVKQAGNEVVAAIAFNAVGNFSHAMGGGSIEHPKGNIWDEGNIGRISAHALVGGALSKMSGGDFGEGAAAAGLNQLLAKPLDSMAGALGGPEYKNNVRNAGAQLAGLAGALATDGDVNVGANIAKNADFYNRQLHTAEIMAISDAAKEMHEKEDISEDEANRRLAELMTSLVNKDWREHNPSSLQDDKAMDYLAKSLADNGLGDLYQPTTGSDVPTLPGETMNNDSADDIKANLLAYADTHSAQFNDRTQGGDALLDPYSPERQFYDKYLGQGNGIGERANAAVQGAAGKIAGVGDVVGDFRDGVEYLFRHPVDSAKAMSYGMQGALADPWGVLGQAVDNYNDANINAYLDGLQGNYFDASRGATAANTKLWLDIAGALPVGKLLKLDELGDLAKAGKLGGDPKVPTSLGNGSYLAEGDFSGLNQPVKVPEISLFPDSSSWFNDVAANATRNPDSNTLVLGHFSREGTSYQKVAAHYGATYFKVDDWSAVTKGLSDDEIWRINEAFLDQQISQRKQILFSHNPMEAKPYSFFEREVNYLQDIGYGFKQKNQWTWEAVYEPK